MARGRGQRREMGEKDSPCKGMVGCPAFLTKGGLEETVFEICPLSGYEGKNRLKMGEISEQV